MKRDAKRAVLTGGIVWGVMVFLMTLMSLYFGYGTAFLKGVASIYPGYNVSLGGSVVGLVYGFLDVYIGVYTVVWVYKKLGK